MGWIGLEYPELEASTRIQRFVAARVGLDRVSSAPRPRLRLLDAELALFDFGTQQPKVGMTDAELDRMKVVVEGNAFPGAMFRYAAALGLNGRSREAAAMLANDRAGRLSKVAYPNSCLRSPA